MATITVAGPKTGANFDLNLSQGTEAHGGSVAAFGANASVNVRMARQPLQTAPERVSIEVNGWTGFQTPAGDPDGYEPRLHRIIYYVEFGDPGSLYEAPEKVLTPWRDRNKGFGPLTAHVYRDPGTYKIQLWAYELDSDRKAYWEQEITVEDPDVTFANDTVFIAADGDFSTAPANNVGTFTTIDAAYEARKPFPITRFMMKSGETHTNHTQQYIDFETGGIRTAAHFVTDGDQKTTFEHDPTVTSGATYAFRVCAGRDNPQPNAEVVFQNIDVQGHWDDVAETGPALQNGWGDFAGRYHLNHFLLDTCAARNCNAGFASDGTAVDEDPEVTLHDFVVERFRDIGVWGGGVPRFNFLGCRIMRGVDASSGGPKGGPPYHNNHGPIRLNSYTKNRVVVDGCDLFNCAGWFVNVTGFRSQQPCIRVNQGSVPGSIFNLQRTSLEGGFYVLDLGRMSNLVNTGAQNHIIDQFVMVASHMSTTAIESDAGGITVGNGLFVVPDVDRILANFKTARFLNLQSPYAGAAGANPNPATLDDPITIKGVTVMNRMTDARDPTGDAALDMVTDPAGYTNVSVDDCVLHQPGAASYTPTVDPEPLTQAQLWQPRMQGYQDNQDQTTLLPQYATPNDTVIQAAPIGASAIVATATARPSIGHEASGRKRPPVATPGAWEKARS